MKKLDEYFKLQKEIYDYFGYEEDWVVIPLEDNTEHFWQLDLNDDGKTGEVLFAKTKESLINQDVHYYSNDIYTQRFLPKWIYPAKDYTMICVDTRVDGNKFLAVFDNKKQIQDVEKK